LADLEGTQIGLQNGADGTRMAKFAIYEEDFLRVQLNRVPGRGGGGRGTNDCADPPLCVGEAFEKRAGGKVNFS